MTSLPPSKCIVPLSKLIITIFACEGGFLMRGVIVPPSKLIVTRKLFPKGGFLLGGFLIKVGRLYIYIYIYIHMYIHKS